MSMFKGKLIADIDGGLPYELEAPFAYYSDLLGRWVTVPTGFSTDLASVPKVLWNVLPPMGNYSDAAVIHDWLYQHNGVTRGQADAVLNEAMEVCGVGRWTRWVIYSGVRVGGWKPWGAYREKDKVTPIGK